jgi:hypothetical protein
MIWKFDIFLVFAYIPMNTHAPAPPSAAASTSATYEVGAFIMKQSWQRQETTCHMSIVWYFLDIRPQSDIRASIATFLALKNDGSNMERQIVLAMAAS